MGTIVYGVKSFRQMSSSEKDKTSDGRENSTEKKGDHQ